MILNSYFVYALISYFVSIPVALAVLKWIVDFFVKEYGILLPLAFKPFHIFTGLLILIVTFFTGYTSRR